MDRDKIKKIVMEMLIENDQCISPRSGRGLFWFALKGAPSTWIYMLGTDPLASVWWAGGCWNYSIPIHDTIGSEEFRADAMARVEKSLADDSGLDGD